MRFDNFFFVRLQWFAIELLLCPIDDTCTADGTITEKIAYNAARRVLNAKVDFNYSDGTNSCSRLILFLFLSLSRRVQILSRFLQLILVFCFLVDAKWAVKKELSHILNDFLKKMKITLQLLHGRVHKWQTTIGNVAITHRKVGNGNKRKTIATTTTTEKAICKTLCCVVGSSRYSIFTIFSKAVLAIFSASFFISFGQIE